MFIERARDIVGSVGWISGLKKLIEEVRRWRFEIELSARGLKKKVGGEEEKK